MILVHAYQNANQATIHDDSAYALILHKTDGTVETIDTHDTMVLEHERVAVTMAMSAVRDEHDVCDVYHFGDYYGTAHYVDMTPNSWFSRMEVVFSRPLY